jgi:hypothetical protein
VALLRAVSAPIRHVLLSALASPRLGARQAGCNPNKWAGDCFLIALRDGAEVAYRDAKVAATLTSAAKPHRGQAITST